MPEAKAGRAPWFVLALLFIIAASLVYLCYEARQSRMAVERQAGAVDTLVQAQPISTWEAVDMMEGLYRQIAMFTKNDSIKADMIARMEAAERRFGVRGKVDKIVNQK